MEPLVIIFGWLSILSFQLLGNYKPSRDESFQVWDGVVLRNVYSSERPKRERKTASKNPHLAAKRRPSVLINVDSSFPVHDIQHTHQVTKREKPLSSRATSVHHTVDRKTIHVAEASEITNFYKV
jgi:hypothetical protein